MAFWILTAFVTLASGALFALVLVRSDRGASTPSASYDLEVYRQQLKDVDKDVARGVIRADEADRIRTEISRRILAADAQINEVSTRGAAANGPARLGAGLVFLILACGTAALYLHLGAPGYGDLGQDKRIAMADNRAENRPDQAAMEAMIGTPPPVQAEAAYVDLVTQLRNATQQRPDDLRGQELLAQHEARLGNFRAAYEAKEQVIELRGPEADHVDFTDLAELQIMAANGYVSPESEAALRTALSLSPGDGRARYYYGLLLGQNGRPDRGYEIWADTLTRGPAGRPWIEAIQSQIPDMALAAGVDYRPIVPPASAPLSGPDAAQINAAQDMTAQDRRAMIEGMVSGLSDRLANEGGSVDEWARLITSLGVLGRGEDALSIYAEAVKAFADNSASLATLEAAKQQLEQSQ